LCGVGFCIGTSDYPLWKWLRGGDEDVASPFGVWHLVRAGFGKGFGGAMSSSLWEGALDGDEDVASSIGTSRCSGSNVVFYLSVVMR
jgi:hypothetical protein